MSTASKGQISYRKVTIGSTNKVFYVTDGVGSQAITLDEDDYWVSGDTATAGDYPDLIEEVRAKILAGTDFTGLTATLTRTGASIGKITFVASGGANATLFVLEWANGSTTFDSTEMGWPAVDTSAGATQTSDNHTKGVWLSDQIGLLYDNNTRRRQLRNFSVADVLHVLELNTHSRQEVSWSFVDRTKIKTALSATNADFETAWASMAQGNLYRFYPDVDDMSTVATWVVDDADWAAELHSAATPLTQGGEKYSVRLPGRTYVSG